jgi:hypothetical protein
MQSQTNSADHAWGTRAAGAEQVYEAGAVNARFREADGVARYALGNAGKKTVIFHGDYIEVRVEHPGKFREQIPLLIKSDARPALDIETADGVERSTKDGPVLFAKTRVQTVNLDASDFLTYKLRVKP